MLQLSTTLSEPSSNGLHQPASEQAADWLVQGRPADALALCEQALQDGLQRQPPHAEAMLCMQAARACVAMGLLRRADTLSARAEALFLRGGHQQDPQRLDNLCDQLENSLQRLEEGPGSPAVTLAQRGLALQAPSADLVRQAQALRAGPLLLRSCELAARLQLLLGAPEAAQAAAALAGAAVEDAPPDLEAQARLLLVQASVALAGGQPAVAQAALARAGLPADPARAQRWHLLAAQVARARHDWQAAHAHAQAWGLHEQHQAEQQRQVILRDMESAHAQALQLLPEVLRGPLLDILDTVRAASAAPGGPELPRIQEVARHALHAADRGLQRARALLDPLLAPGTVDLAEAADDAVACLGAQAQAAHLLLQLQLDPPAWVRAPRGLLHAGLVHLLGLAMQRTPPGGQVSLRIQADTAFTWHVQLLDQGPGRGASARAPAGPVPGLVFIERMVHRLGGSLRAGDDPEGGGLVELWLPAVSAPDP